MVLKALYFEQIKFIIPMQKNIKLNQHTISKDDSIQCESKTLVKALTRLFWLYSI